MPSSSIGTERVKTRFGAPHGRRLNQQARPIFLAYAGSVLALLFALTPGRLLGDWVRGAAPARAAAQHP